MSEIYIPEICDSNFKHHQMVEIDKAYYQRADGKILCAECIEPWIPEQAEKILDRVKPWIISALDYLNEGYMSSDQWIKYSDLVMPVEYMRSVLTEPFHVYFSSTETDPIEIGLSYGDSFSTEFSVDLGDDTQWTDAIEEAFEAKLEGILHLFIYSIFSRMSAESVQIIVETLGSLYSSISSTANSNCECENIPDVEGECCVCGKGLVKPYYIYYNQAYCVDDMYAIVVKAAVKSNLSEYVGIADPNEPPLPSNPVPYQDTREWKMGVIDKYFMYMEEYVGSIPGHKVI